MGHAGGPDRAAWTTDSFSDVLCRAQFCVSERPMESLSGNANPNWYQPRPHGIPQPKLENGDLQAVVQVNMSTTFAMICMSPGSLYLEGKIRPASKS